MPKKKQLTLDKVTNKLSRLKSKDLPLIGVSGLNEGDSVAPFGTLSTDIIEYCLYDTSDNYLASGELPNVPNNLDVGAHVRSLGYERGTYKVVYNFLRQIGGSSKYILTKKIDKSVYSGDHFVDTDGKIYAGTIRNPIIDEKSGKQIELLIQDDKYWIQEISPSRTEIRIRPNPAINDLDYYEQFRLLGYTCLSYSDISGETHVTFASDGKTATINGPTQNLNGAMEGGTLKIRDAFIIDYEESPEQILRYNPTVETEVVQVSKNLITNGHFSDGDNIIEFRISSGNHEIIEFENPGNSPFVLKTESDESNNNYEIILDGIPGESYIMSCWVYWNSEWPESNTGIFSGKINNGTTEQSINPSRDGVVERKDIDGREWIRVYKRITIPENSNGTIKWFLGKTSNTDSGIRYITNVQIEPGSTQGVPGPFMEKERVEDEDIPTTGLITFTDNNKVTATFSDTDDGFTSLMTSDENGRGKGRLIIKDAYVVDEVFSEENELLVLDDIPLKNATADDIVKGEGKFRISPFHESGANKIILRVDNWYKLYSIDGNGNETSLGDTEGISGAHNETYTHTLPDSTVSIRLETHENSGGAGLIAKIFWNGTVIKTGDGTVEYHTEEENREYDYSDVDEYDDWHELDYIVSIVNTGPIKLISNSKGDASWVKVNRNKKNVHPQLKDCEWVWAGVRRDNQDLTWTWTPELSATDVIWQYWDPKLHSDAVKVAGWSEGFNSFNWGGNDDARTSKSRWHSGWLGHHAKWVEGEGQFGNTCMKFIDQNSEFLAPNHTDYPGTKPHRTGNNTNANQPTTLEHRWLGINQKLPHTLASQGIEPGDNITISWWQKSDVFGKGAQVGLHHYKKSDGNVTWGEDIPNAPGLSDNQFLRFVPTSKVGEWEQVSYTGIVDDDWDLTRASSIYIYGHHGPEGILWVENVEIQKTQLNENITKSPVTADLVAEIDNIVDNNTVILNDTYDNLAPQGSILNNALNIHSYSTFPEFYVDYTSSVEMKEPVYGTLRGDIENISGNQIILVNTYTELGETSNHDFDNTFNVNQNSQFNKWFIQYPADNSENFSKLLKLGPNEYDVITNFKIDTQTYPEYPYSVAYKLYDPLPERIQENDFVTIVREMIPPIEETCTLIPFVEEFISDIVLRVPERSNVNSPIGTGVTEYKTYDNLVTTNSTLKETIENEVLSGSLSVDINVDYSQFSNFIHFGSAEKRVRNFKYKLDLIEQYTDRSASLAGAGSGSTGLHSVVADPGNGSYLLVSGSSSYNPPFSAISGSTAQIAWWEKKRRETINSFDKFEKYMFNQSSSYSSESIGIFNDNAWPKRSGLGTYSSPYVLSRTSQSLASNWYSNQLVSASLYDRENNNRIRGHLPMFIQDDSDNSVFLNFVDMVGHYFDDIWVFVKSMTDVHDRRDKLNEGIAKDLLLNVAQSLGWEVKDGKDLISIPRYMLGMEQTGSETPWQYAGTSEKDISREIWSRIINNMPYFLKTKGTTRAIKGLISCYGIPSSILRVIEYGGPKLEGKSSEHFLTRKFTKALDFFGASNNTYVQNDTWQSVTLGDGATNRYPDTVEFRFKAVTGSNQVLVRRGDDWSIRLKDNSSSDRYGYVSFMLSGSNGYNEVTSSELPVYDGEFYSVMLTRTSASGNYLSGDGLTQDVVYKLYTKKYDAGRSKIYLESTNTLVVCGSLGTVSQSYNASWTGSGNTITIGGPESSDFGESLSGSMMEYRNWTTALNESAFDNHVAAPISFDGNHPSASWTDMILRYSFDDDKDLSVGANQWFQDVSADQSFTSSASPYNYTSGLGDHFSSVVDETKMKVPNLGPVRRSSAKIRIEDDTLVDPVQKSNPILKFGESITTPAYDNAPIDSNKLGIFFSPSAVIDEDIILSMPNLDFDQYIGDPRDQYKEQYTGLVTARNLYWQKYSGPNNFWDYLRLLKYYDNSLYKQIRDLVPARSNANIGIMIEPTVLERDKIVIAKEPTFESSHYTTNIDSMVYISESANYPNYDTNINYSNPFNVSSHTQETGSYISASSEYIPLDSSLSYTNPFNVNFHTNESGSFISSSANYEDLNTNINLRNPFLLNNNTQITGSGISFSAELISYNAPSYTLSEISSGTGSYMLKDFLERPSLYNVGDIDYSGWYSSDYYNATIQRGSQKSIFEEVVQPRIEQSVLSDFNYETEYFYSSSLSASLHKPYSSSFVLSDFDNKWDEFLGTDRLFYLGCVQSDSSTVSDIGKRYEDKTPVIEVTLTAPTKLVTTDKASTKLDVKR